MNPGNKYIFWLDDASRLTGELRDRGHDVFVVKKAVCIPLSPQYDIGVIPPGVWGDYTLCRRQLSWYYQSPFAGKTLLISSTDLSGFGIEPETVVTPRPSFQPPELPDEAGIDLLRRDPAFKRIKPSSWDQIQGEDFQRWIKTMRAGDMTPEDLLRHHSANHANFITPRHTVSEGGAAAPYSIGPTARVCSACLEFYNIIGRDSRTKYVMPCPGAVLFARLERNVYYEVVTAGRAAAIPD